MMEKVAIQAEALNRLFLFALNRFQAQWAGGHFRFEFCFWFGVLGKGDFFFCRSQQSFLSFLLHSRQNLRTRSRQYPWLLFSISEQSKNLFRIFFHCLPALIFMLVKRFVSYRTTTFRTLKHPVNPIVDTWMKSVCTLFHKTWRIQKIYI